MVQRSAPAPFLTKTYQLVEDVSTDEIVSWNEIGTTFVIWSTADFAKDLLPKYFKHCNYSSFVRQLNTYGFRKITADKWEFANENFVRGKKELLSKIRRRKAHRKSSATAADVIHLPAAPLPANSGDDDSAFSSSKNPASSSVEAPPAPAAPATAFMTTTQNSHDELAEENQKLKKDNEMLSTELTQAKKQCDDLVAFLTKKVKVGADQINLIMRNGSDNIRVKGLDHNYSVPDNYIEKEIGNNNTYGLSSSAAPAPATATAVVVPAAGGDSLKLFGVWLKKRGRDENSDFLGGVTHRKEFKKSSFEFKAPWMNSSKVCI